MLQARSACDAPSVAPVDKKQRDGRPGALPGQRDTRRDTSSGAHVPRVNTRILHTFITLFNSGSVASVADRLRVSRATVLYQLHSLEDRVGTLFYVQPDGVLSPTPLALEMAPKVRSMLGIWTDLVGEATACEEAPEAGRLRIGVVGAAELVAPHVLAHVNRMHPRRDAMAVPLATEGALVQALRSSAIQLGLSLGAADGFQVVTDCVAMHCRMMLVCARSQHARFMATPVHALPWLLEDSMPGLSADLGVWFRAVLAGGEARVRAQSAGVLLDLLSAGLGVTLLPEIGLRRYLAERDLMMLQPAAPFTAPPPVRLCVVAASTTRSAACQRTLARDLYRALVADVESGATFQA